MSDLRASVRSLLLLSLLLALGGVGCSNGSALFAAPNARSSAGADETNDGPEYDPEDPFADDDDDQAGDDDDSEPPNEPVQVVDFDPPAGSVDHHYRRPIIVTFNDYALAASVSVLDNVSGYSIPLESEWNEAGTRLTAQPTLWLQPETGYTVVINLGDASLEYTFTTSAVGTPLDLPSGADGRTYELDFADATSPSSPVLGSLLSEPAGGTWLWRTQYDGDTFTIVTGVGSDDDGDGYSEQDPCTATNQLVGSELELYNPYFASSPALMGLWVDGVPLLFEEAWVDGDFGPGGAALEELAFRGYLREDSVEELLGDDNGCGVMQDVMGLTCQECPSGSGDCAWFEVERVRGVQMVSSLEDVDADEVATECSDGDPVAMLGSCSTASNRVGSSALALVLAALGLAGIRRRAR